ncbi:hypothetical protein [uncultured Tateyamaria sp.]|uniref:hypothetical protein n=1 Tax=Tateyamaria sp. 1078 TaxID=3417464 RepID=UPI00262B0107|nr:hypothetical protein [uncultured Tateyamaria sp.]
MARFVLSVGAYVGIVFPLAILWHLVLFKERYHAFGYFDGDPDLALGLATITAQAILLALLYKRIALPGGEMRRALTFGLTLGAFYWTCHVLAFLAKQSTAQPWAYLVMETGYLSLQFGFYSIALWVIHRPRRG